MDSELYPVVDLLNERFSIFIPDRNVEMLLILLVQMRKVKNLVIYLDMLKSFQWFDNCFQYQGQPLIGNDRLWCFSFLVIYLSVHTITMHIYVGDEFLHCI